MSDWEEDDGGAAPPASNGGGGFVDTGRSFSMGRGFAAFDATASSNGGGGGYEGGRRGRGGYDARGRIGRDRGGRGGSGGYGRSDYDRNGEGDGGYEDGGYGDRGGSRGRGGGRGRGGRGGGGGGGRGDDGGDQPEKPRELYVPPEPSNEESDVFQSGIATGTNFDAYYNIKVHVSGENVPPAVESFEKSGLRPLVISNVAKANYRKPTPIQKRAIPIVMQRRDLMGCAQTGSGKTAAFLLPIISILLEEKAQIVSTGSGAQPQAIVMLPTRELAIQIWQEARKFAHQSSIKTAIAYGGTATHDQAGKIRSGCNILIATTGRLLDFVERGYVSFESVMFVVLDEADRMLDMGFKEDIEKVMNHRTMVPKEDRQTLMFSATFPENIQRLAANFLKDYIFITVGIVGGACADVEQVFYDVQKFQKKDKLKEVLMMNGTQQTLVFVETKRNADYIGIYVAESLGLKATTIHGDRLQREREEALNDFKSGRCSILIATAVAARGLDIKNVGHVINYDLPKCVDEYVHRIGRTGRLGNRGKATSFYDSSEDYKIAADLIKVLKQAEQEVPDFIRSSGQSDYNSGVFGGEDVRNIQTSDDVEEAW